MATARNRLVLCALLAAGAAACARHAGEAVARVGGTEITREALEQAQDRIAGGVAVDPSVRRKILDSLVLNRALALAQEPQLTDQERRVIAADLQAHHDQVLARMYLAAHGAASAPTDAQVRAYYEQHASQFGGGVEHLYEMVFSTEVPGGPKGEAALDALNQIKTDTDWETATAKQARLGVPLAYRKGSSAEALLHQRLKSVIDGMAKNAPPQLTLVEGRAYLLRVGQEAARTPQPLAQVRGSIEQALAAQRVKQALDAVAPEVLKQVKVEYLEEAGS